MTAGARIQVATLVAAALVAAGCGESAQQRDDAPADRAPRLTPAAFVDAVSEVTDRRNEAFCDGSIRLQLLRARDDDGAALSRARLQMSEQINDPIGQDLRDLRAQAPSDYVDRYDDYLDALDRLNAVGERADRDVLAGRTSDTDTFDAALVAYGAAIDDLNARAERDDAGEFDLSHDAETDC